MARHVPSATGGREIAREERAGRVRLRALAVLLTLVSLGLFFARDASPVAPHETARAILERERCQTELPPGSAADGGSWASSASQGLGIVPLLLPEASGLVQGLVYAAIVVALVLGLALLLRMLRGRLVRASEAAAAAPPEARSPAPRAVPDHERLAQEGRFPEAIHALLLGALRDLSRRTAAGGLAASASSTSREVLHGAPPELRKALAPLVSAVEHVYFGASAAGVEDYAACVGQYRSFAAACRNRA